MAFNRARDLESTSILRSDVGLLLRPVSWLLRYGPLAFFFVYLNATVALFVWGPWPWPVRSWFSILSFLAAAHLALVLGYVAAARSNRPRVYRTFASPNYLVAVSALVTIALLVPTASFRAGGLFADVAGAISNPGAAYQRSLVLRDESPPFVEYIRIICAPLSVLLLPLLVFYWRQIRAVTRVAGCVAIGGTVLLFVAMGTNKAIADTVLVAPWILLAAHLSGRMRLSRYSKLGVVVLSLVCFSLFLGFFTATQATRSGASAAFGYLGTVDMRADYEHPLVKELDPPLQIGVLGLSLYVNTGYYGLYLSLQQDWEPTFGVGNSFFLTRQASRLLDDPRISARPYPMRAQQQFGWDATGLWSSIYPWIASDVSFPGTIVFVFLVGYGLARSWLDTLSGNSPIAVAVFAQLVVMLFYFPGNNQVLQFGEGLSGFVVSLLAWWWTARTFTAAHSNDPSPSAE